MAETKTPPRHARAVVVGGGVAGCSVAYHLTKLGWKDVVVLERKQIACGTTWHAAGLIGQLRATRNLTRLAKYTRDLYGRLEAETGVATGMREVGSVSVALTAERHEELLRLASMARAFGVEVEEISAAEAGRRHPHLNVSDAIGAVYLPGDGQGDPANIAQALAKGARQGGASVLEGFKATAVRTKNGRVSGVAWQRDGSGESGEIAADAVVNCAGMWGRDFAKASGVNLPLQACEHFYIVTEPVMGLGRLPVLRVPDECAYYKEDAGKIMLGAFEPKAKPWGMTGIPEEFCFDQLPEDFAHFEPILDMAVKRMPLLAKAGIRTFFNGPESFTPDVAYHLGEAPELPGYYVAAGFNSIGIQSAGGAGMALAHWMEHGHPPFDLSDVDVARMQPFMGNRKFLAARVTESLGLLYADHFPFRQKASARGVRRTPFHEHLARAGAVFGETAGWERANWYAEAGEPREYRYSWGRQNWFKNAAREHAAMRTGAGMYDMSSFGKIRVEGPDACAFLNRVCGAQVDVPTGRIVYTQFLNERGGIEADVTATRLSETAYLVVTPTLTVVRDLAWLRRHQGEARVALTDVTAGEGTLAVMGPKARDLLRLVSPDDFGNESHPFGHARTIEIGLGLARAHRVSFVGELGWEIYATADMAGHVFETLAEAGREVGLKLCGLHAMDSCRIEKAYRHFGHDISGEDHVLEAGLGFAVSQKKGDFVGRDAVLRRRDEGLRARLVQFRLEDPQPLLFHNEPIVRDGRIVSQVTSGAYGHHLGAAIGLGYVPCERQGEDEILASKYEIEIAGRRHAAVASLKPMHDPAGARMRA